MAADDEGPRTVNVSKDFLRAELNGMELRLVDKLALLATKAEVEGVDARLTKAEETLARIKGALALLSLLALALGGLLVKLLTG